eukprot:COSAG06_NODE_449_length_15623_cov_50.097204_20_plen_66_part_00
MPVPTNLGQTRQSIWRVNAKVTKVLQRNMSKNLASCRSRSRWPQRQRQRKPQQVATAAASGARVQ